MRGRMKNMPEKKLRILYVEDDRSLAASLKLGLRRHAIELACAYTCREALQKMRSDVFDFYLIDVRLSDGNGFDLCRDIRETDRTPIIFLTGETESGSRSADMSWAEMPTSTSRLPSKGSWRSSMR